MDYDYLISLKDLSWNERKTIVKKTLLFAWFSSFLDYDKFSLTACGCLSLLETRMIMFLSGAPITPLKTYLIKKAKMCLI